MTPSPPHVMYGKLSEKELRDKINILSSQRGSSYAGRDLIEMRKESKRRRDVRLAQKKVRVYNKKIKDNSLSSEEKKMLDRPEKGRKFKKGEFIAGMSPKQEKFCMEYISTGDPLVAYKAAGYALGETDTINRQRAARVLATEKIKTRIDTLRDEAIDRMAWSSDHVLNRLDEVYQHALSNGDYTNANRSIEAVAKHLGMFVDRTESKIKMSSFSNETDKEAVEKDIAKLAEIAGLKVISGGKE